MGWASGSEIAEDIWKLVRVHIPRKERKDIANQIIEIFEDKDCDTMEEAELLSKDACRTYGTIDFE